MSKTIGDCSSSNPLSRHYWNWLVVAAVDRGAVPSVSHELQVELISLFFKNSSSFLPDCRTNFRIKNEARTGAMSNKTGLYVCIFQSQLALRLSVMFVHEISFWNSTSLKNGLMSITNRH